MSNRLDSADVKILRAVQKDAKITTKELSEVAGLTPSPTFDRLKKLEREGFIKGYAAIVDSRKAGNGIIVLCNIRLKQHTRELITAFMNAVQDIEEITECYNTSGNYDFVIKVYARDMQAYQSFMLNTLGTMDCIGSLHSVFAIGEIKHSYIVPVHEQTV